MNSNQACRWEKARQSGKNKFIIYTGILQWGLITGALWSIIMFLMSKDPKNISHFSSILVPAIIIFPICGYFMGLITWNGAEKKYQKYIQEKQSINT